MYCPKCGQQVSENMRFCSRCGLQINEVADWLSGGAALAAREEPQATTALSPKRRGMRRGAKIMFWGGVLAPIFLALSIAADSPFPLVVPCVILLAGFSMLLYSILFGEELPFERSQKAQEQVGAMPANSALPPVTNTGIGSNVKEARTAEMAQPPSVTEHTTRLLNNE